MGVFWMNQAIFWACSIFEILKKLWENFEILWNFYKSSFPNGQKNINFYKSRFPNDQKIYKFYKSSFPNGLKKFFYPKFLHPLKWVVDLAIPVRHGSQAPPASGDVFWMNQAIFLACSIFEILKKLWENFGILWNFGRPAFRTAIYTRYLHTTL